MAIADNQGSGTITNDDSILPSVTINDVSTTEGNSPNTTDLTFTVTLNAASVPSVSVDFATADNTATTADNDYQLNSGTLNFAGNAGETQTFTVTVNGDDTVELDETFFVNLSTCVNCNIADNQGSGTITNDDAAEITINDIIMNEGNTPSTTAFTFTATLDSAVDTGISVDAATADGTATVADNDYLANSGTLNFVGNAGETQTFTVTVNGDDTVEPDQDFFVNLSNLLASGRNVAIADNQGSGTITNDDVTNTPKAAIGNILEEIDDLVESEDIDKGIGNSINSKLKAALKSLENNNSNSACGQLGSAINQIDAQNGKKIDSDLAEEWIEEIEDVKVALGC